LSVHRKKNAYVGHHHEYKEKDKSIFREIKCQLHHSSPDNCEVEETNEELAMTLNRNSRVFVLCKINLRPRTDQTFNENYTRKQLNGGKYLIFRK
jgi:hypothetical protein